ncbi:efflux RND transporter periplasmic adaptor subunit [Qipengyuania sediminis]|uniref:efflux RND transporter periplasmic adaptor subunit n=1 Tax=Qipengyuania sediminis TaxID=1532023 RepID=UPI001059AEDA|nr:efflux RND transporter periplasmic adaptor subunit [Qipengyuania sediminis]
MNYETSVVADRSADLDGEDGGRVATGRRRRNWIIFALIALALAIAAWFLFLRGGEPAPAADPDAQLPLVTVVAPGRTTIEGTISATGTIAARREIPVGVVGEGGRVVSVAADQGSWVRQGQVLVTVDRSVQTQQASGAQAQIGVARADANLAQANLDRALKLVARGFVSKADVDRLTATRDAAVARVRVAEAGLRELQARNARLNIYAPVSGLILTRNVEPGATIGAGSQPVFTMAQGGEMELLARLGEEDLAQITTGTSVTVTPVGLDRSYTGQVWQVEPTIDPQTRQGTARVALAYAPGLRPGGFASAVINSGTVVAPLLPESAVQSDAKGNYVYIVGSDNKVARRDVTTGIVTERGIAITGGLTGQERVVLRAGGFLNPGDKVRPRAGTTER